MDTMVIIKAFDLDPSLKKRLLEIHDNDPIKWFKVIVFFHRVCDYLLEVRKLEKLYIKRLNEELPRLRSVSQLLDEDDFPDIGTLDAFDRELYEEAEEEFIKRPDTFSNYIIVSATDKLRDLLAGM